MFKTIRFVLVLSMSALALPLFGGTVAGASSSPQCIVSLSPAATETLYAIGAGSRVQAVDTDSNYPTKGLPTKRIDPFNPSVEGLLGICKATPSHPSTKPDLVIISYDANTIKEQLSAAGIKVILQDAPTSVSGAMHQIRQLGALTGHIKRASALVTSIKKSIARDIALIPKHPKKKLTVYYETGTNPYYSLTSRTFAGSLLKSLGVVNIADANSTSADAGYPQLSSEYIASANPKLIFLADTICCGVTSVNVARRPGFARISAVMDHHVVGLNDDIASRWGPRLPILMNELTHAVRVALNDKRLWKKKR